MSTLPFRPVMVVTLLAAGSLAPHLLAQAQPASAAAIYTCVDDRGRRLTADRPIAECTSKEQRVLNKDGSLKTVYPPILTAEERAEKEARERRTSEARAALNDAVRRDRNLLARYPNEMAHRKAREAALETMRAAIKARESRLAELSVEREPLIAEAEFYKGRPLPLKLRGQIEANDAAAQAQRESAASQEAEVERVTGLYDAELARLKQLWAGAAPGSLGTLNGEPAAIPVASGASNLKPSNLR
jgi:hypothetical protein